MVKQSSEQRANRLGLECDSTFSDWEEHESPTEAEIEHSKAISLKRIADALWGDNDTTGIIQLLNGLEQAVRNGS